MKITQTKITKLPDSKTLAFASITFDGCFVVTGLKVLNGKNGLWVAMPNRKKDEEYIDTSFPITKEFRQYIIDTVLAEYNKGGQVEVLKQEGNTRREEDRVSQSIDVSESDLPF